MVKKRLLRKELSNDWLTHLRRKSRTNSKKKRRELKAKSEKRGNESCQTARARKRKRPTEKKSVGGENAGFMGKR